MKAKTKNLSNQYGAADAGVKSIPIHTPESGKMFIGNVSVNLTRAVDGDQINSFKLVIVNETTGEYSLLRRLSAADFSSAEQRDMLGADGSRYHISNLILSASDTLKVESDVAPSDQIHIDIRLSGFEDADR